MCCSVLQCVAVCRRNCMICGCVCKWCAAMCCSVLFCVAVSHRELQHVAVCYTSTESHDLRLCLGSVLQCAIVRCSVLQYVAVCCSVLQCVAACCSVLQCVAVWYRVLQCVAACVTYGVVAIRQQIGCGQRWKLVVYALTHSHTHVPLHLIEALVATFNSVHTHTHIHALSLSLSLPPPSSLSLSHTHTHSRTHAHTLTHAHTRTLTHTCAMTPIEAFVATLDWVYTHSLSFSPSLFLSLSHTHTHSRIFQQTRV